MGWRCALRFTPNGICFVKDLKNYRKAIIFIVCFCWDILTMQADFSPIQSSSELLCHSMSIPAGQDTSLRKPPAALLQGDGCPELQPFLFKMNLIALTTAPGFAIPIVFSVLEVSTVKSCPKPCPLHTSLGARDNLEGRPEPSNLLYRNPLFQAALDSVSPTVSLS